MAVHQEYRRAGWLRAAQGRATWLRVSGRGLMPAGPDLGAGEAMDPAEPGDPGSRQDGPPQHDPPPQNAASPQDNQPPQDNQLPQNTAPPHDQPRDDPPPQNTAPSHGRPPPKAAPRPGGKPRGGSRHAPLSRGKKILAWTGGVMAVIVVVAVLGTYFVYRHLNANLHQVDISSDLGSQPVDLHPQAENILVLGSDSRIGQGKGYGNSAVLNTDRSDTLMIVHIAADRQWADVMSIPRDSWVNIPACRMGNGRRPRPPPSRSTRRSPSGPCTGTAPTSASPARSKRWRRTPASGLTTLSPSTSTASVPW